MLIKKSDIQQRQRFSQKVTVWLGACLKSVRPLVMLDKRTVDYTISIGRVPPVALKYGNQVFGSDWAFQQDGARPHSHHLPQQ